MRTGDRELLTAAAAMMRHDVQRLLDEMDASPEYWEIGIGDVEAYRQSVEDGLGGPGGQYAAAWHPGVALAVAGWLEVIASYSILHELAAGARGGVSLEWDAAVAVARSYLKPSAAGPVREVPGDR